MGQRDGLGEIYLEIEITGEPSSLLTTWNGSTGWNAEKNKHRNI